MTGTIERIKETELSKKRAYTINAIEKVYEKASEDASSIFNNNHCSDESNIEKIRRILGWKNGEEIGKVNITYDMANELLKFNTKNRKLNKSAIQRYSQSLMDGSFSLSNDMITFDDNGVLTNGQHRLIAVTETRKVLPTIIMIGIEQSPEMDRGITRNIVDNIMMTCNLDEELRNANIIKTCKALLDNIRNRQKYTCEQLKDFIENNKEAILDAYNNNLLVLQGNTTHVFNVHIAAAFLAATIYYKNEYKYNPDAYDAIMDMLVNIREVLTTSVPKYENDSFIIKLRDKIKDCKRDKKKLTTDNIYRSTQYVIYHYCKGEAKSVILCTKEYF